MSAIKKKDTTVVLCDTVSVETPKQNYCFSIYETENAAAVQIEGCVPRNIAQVLMSMMAQLSEDQ